MLAGDTPVSNADPFATGFTNDADWVTGLGAHLMILVPGEDSLKVPRTHRVLKPGILIVDCPAHVNLVGIGDVADQLA